MPEPDGIDLARLVAAWNDTERDWGPFEPVQAAIRRAALARRSGTALVDGPERWSYDRLCRQAARLRLALTTAGVGRGATVAVHLDRQPAVVCALLAILESGAAYLPVEPALPEARLAAMLDDAQAGCVLTTRAGADRLPATAAAVVCVDDLPPLDGRAVPPPPVPVAPTDIAYIIFTSGSTGRPKGVRGTHAGLRNRLLWMQATFPLDDGDVVLQKTPLGFDVSLWELLWPLLAGAQMAIAEPDGHRDPAYLAALIRRAGVTVAHFVPSMLDVFLEEPASSRCPSLRFVMASGEELTRPAVQRFHRRLPGATLHNLYGPTEASIDVSHHPCRPGDEGAVPIGRPIANTILLVLDDHGDLVPPGGTGELCIGGVGLAAGYTDADLTRARFVPNPHPIGGPRLYHTGDLVRQRPDGELVFLGRIDNQVKLRGVRLELGEVEAVLRGHDGVTAAGAVVVTDDGPPRLEAFVVPAAGATVRGDVLREHCRRHLPAAAVPARLHLVEGLPLSANGKLARAALCDLARRLAPAPLTGPTEETEGWAGPVIEAWTSVAGPPAGPDGDLITAGGDSLTAMRILARLRAHHGISVRIGDFLARPTPRALTALAEQGSRTGRTTAAGHAGDAPVRLTDGQSQIWLAEHLVEGPSPYTLCAGIRLPATPDPRRLQGALARLHARHPVLRAVVRLDDRGDLVMVDHDEAEPDLAVLHADAHHAAETLRHFAGQPFTMDRQPPVRWCLLELAGESWLYLAAHHVLVDGWSWHVLAGELLALLAGGVDRRAPSFLDYARQASSLASAGGGSQPVPAAITTWADHPGHQPAVLAERFVGPAQRRCFELSCRALGVTPHAGLLALLAVQVARREPVRPHRVTVATTVSGRDEPGWEGAVGCFVRAQPVELPIPDRASLAVVAPAAHAAVLARLAGPASAGGRSPLGAVLTLQNTPLPAGLGHRARREVSCGRTKYGVRLDVAPWDGGWSVAFERPQGALHDAETLADEYCALVAAAGTAGDLVETALPQGAAPRPDPARFVA